VKGELTPLGSARERIGRPDGAAALYPAELGRRLRTHDLGRETLALAWELARQPPDLAAGERSALVYLAAASMIAVRAGSTRLSLGDELGALFESLGAGPAAAETARRLLTEGRIASIAGVPGERKPLLLDGAYLYHERMLRLEDAVVARLAPRLRMPAAAAGPEDALADVAARPAGGVALSDEQRQAVLAALARPLTIVSGGPGTGKTSIVVSILRVLARSGTGIEKVALAAPTGKAAHRMRESIERALRAVADPSPEDERLRAVAPEPVTLHRLLGYAPGEDRFRHHAQNPLSQELVIVDEASMIDLFLMERLLGALGEHARLVLLGDADQLPSVNAGAVLRDLLPGPAAGSVFRLTRSYRARREDAGGSAILGVAEKINAGDPEALLGEVSERAGPASVRFEGVERVPPGARAAFLERWLDERIFALPCFEDRVRRTYRLRGDRFEGPDAAEVETLLGHLERSRILCVTRGDALPTGAGAVNAALHRRFLAKLGRDAARPAPMFYPGEPILMLENDYDRGLFNGDQGVVLRVSEGERGSGHQFMAVFARGSGHAAFHLDPLRGLLDHCFAMTVHKSQGSELDHAALLLPDDDLPLLGRELLYTALTRSRRSVVVVGSAEVLRRGVLRRIDRSSGIGEKLARAVTSAAPCVPARLP
jgi:exodeoxyribonuclease V alpha subunit